MTKKKKNITSEGLPDLVDDFFFLYFALNLSSAHNDKGDKVLTLKVKENGSH